jgi:hypothetical protein
MGAAVSDSLFALQKSPGSEWQLLAEIDLPVGSYGAERVVTWLVETLRPLGLHASFLKKIIDCAQQAAQRDLALAPNTETIHLLIYAPASRPSSEQSWGFFRIEKREQRDESAAPFGHAVAFYLYLEG